MTEYIRPDYQAAYSQLARKFTMLYRIGIMLHPSVSSDEAEEVDSIMFEAMRLIEAVEKAELTAQVIEKEES